MSKEARPCGSAPRWVQLGTTRDADYLSFLAAAERKAVDSDQCLDMDDSEADDFEVIPDRDAVVLTGPRVPLEDPMSSSAKRACAVPAVSRILTQPDIGMEDSAVAGA